VLEQLTPDQAMKYLLDAYTRGRNELRSVPALPNPHFRNRLQRLIIAPTPRQPNALVETIDDTIRCVVTHAGLMLQNTPLWRMPRFPNGTVFPFLSINCVSYYSVLGNYNFLFIYLYIFY
jgi:hypothetical protein